MSTDIVRIALTNFTDWVKFEQLATEIMRDEGYPIINPLFADNSPPFINHS